MQIVIDIPDSAYKVCYDLRNVSDTNCLADILVNAVGVGTPIPDHDCDSCEKAWTDKCERAECYENNYKHWTPYQKGDKDDKWTVNGSK